MYGIGRNFVNFQFRVFLCRALQQSASYCVLGLGLTCARLTSYVKSQVFVTGHMFSEKIIEHYFLFYSTRDEVTGERRKLHNEELNDLYSSPNIVRVIISKRMRWAGHVARMGEEERSIQGFGGET